MPVPAIAIAAVGPRQRRPAEHRFVGSRPRCVGVARQADGAAEARFTREIRSQCDDRANFAEIAVIGPDPVDNCNAASTLSQRKGSIAVLPDQQPFHLLARGAPTAHLIAIASFSTRSASFRHAI
jgi:hypothetical protein